MRLLLLFLLLAWAASAQELPPPGGWPLRPVAELRAAPEPPGGLVPYRQGTLWGFADTTGRVWIRPVFASEPPRFGAGLLLWTAQKPKPGDGHPSQEKQPKLLGSWNLRYGFVFNEGDYGRLVWALSFRKMPKSGEAFLLNAHGEQLLVTASQAIAATATDGWRAVERSSAGGGLRELVALEGSAIEPAWKRPGRVFTVPLGPQLPAVPDNLTNRGRYDPDVDFSTPYFHVGVVPLYLAQKVNRLRPTVTFTATRDGLSRQVQDTRYRYNGRFALFDERGRRLTDFRYAGMRYLLPRRLAYLHLTDSLYQDADAADSSGVLKDWTTEEGPNQLARRYGLLDRQGHGITPPLYLRLEAAAPNSLWVVAVRGGRLHYGLLDTLGRYLLPLSPRPISLPDAAGLLRRRSGPPQPTGKARDYSLATTPDVQYPDTSTVQYLRLDGRPAFAGRFRRADAFWRGRALVQSPGGQYGLLDSLGRWVLPPQPDELSYYAYSPAHYEQWEQADPLLLFDHLNGETGRRGGGYFGTLPGNAPLLLAHNGRGYGLRDGRTGQVVAPAVFDKRPLPWYGGVAGQHRGQPLGYSFLGQPFNPNAPASYPPGVIPLTPKPYVAPRPLLQRTEQGWRTRGGRRLWQD